MASETGQNGNTFNRSGEWNTFYKTSNFTKLIYEELGTNKYKFYKHGSELYFLIDKNDNYIGHIELHDSKITSSFSLLNGGFYNIMFTLILTQIPYILSDKELSSQAIRSYEKLNTLPSKKFKLYISDSGLKTKIPFDKNTLLSSTEYRVLITEKNLHSMRNSVEDYYTRINLYDSLSGYPKSLTKYHNEGHEICDLYLFNEYISLINEGYLDLNTNDNLKKYALKNIPINKLIFIKGTPTTIEIGYITDDDKQVWFDISHIIDISKTENEFIKYFDKIPLADNVYDKLVWKTKIII